MLETQEQKPARLLDQSSIDYRDPEKGQAVRTMFAGIAHCYDRLNHLLSFNRDKAWRRKTVELSAPQSGMDVLDVCCGTGDLALEFWRTLKQQGNQTPVIATDFTPEMLAIADKKSTRAQANIRHSVADTLALPFPDKRFDICSVAFGIRNVQDVKAGIKEMARVIKPGGKVVILEFTQPKRRILQSICRFYMTRVLPWIGHKLSRSKDKAYSYLPDSIALFPGPLELVEMMRECGLENVSYKKMTLGIVAIQVGTSPTTT